MKKLKCLVLVAILSLTAVNVDAQIQVNSIGNVGIGTSATAGDKLTTNGTVRFDNWTDVFLNWGGAYGNPQLYPENSELFYLGRPDKLIGHMWAAYIHCPHYYSDSDERIKDSIVVLDNPISKLKKIHGYHYKFNDKYVKSMTAATKKQLKGRQIGFIAQEIEKEFPELVCYPDSANPIYGVDYTKMVPILVEVFKQQQTLIETQTTQIETLQKEVAQMKKSNGSRNKDLDTQSTDSQTATNIESAILYQNAPNPFSKTTEIRFYLPSSVKNAALYIYDMQGIQKKKIEVSQRANGSITINGSEFVAGMYIYTLIADGKEIDTKRMILTE